MAKSKRTPAVVSAFEAAVSPVYLIDEEHTIVYANAALAAWAGLDQEEVVGRRLDYHSEPGGSGGLLAGLCPPPVASAGERTTASISVVGRDGRLRRRRAEFLPLLETKSTAGESKDEPSGCSVLAFADRCDLAPSETAEQAHSDTTYDQLHAALLAQRRSANEQLLPCLLGSAASTARLRRQAEAAASSRANCLIVGIPSDGTAELARWIFLRQQPAADAKFLPLDAGLLQPDQLLDRLSEASRLAESACVTVVLERIDQTPASTQMVLAAALGDSPAMQLLATCANSKPSLAAPLSSLLCTFTIEILPLAERREDLPLLSQWCIEQANALGDKQVTGVAPEAADLLALHPWPGGVAQLRSALIEAHTRTNDALIQPSDLPTALHQASLALELPSQAAEAIVLDELLGEIEQELIERALLQAKDNKAEAARLLGMTRPRLYRRLARLGMLASGEEVPSE